MKSTTNFKSVIQEQPLNLRPLWKHEDNRREARQGSDAQLSFKRLNTLFTERGREKRADAPFLPD